MIILRTPAAISRLSGRWRGQGRSIGFVPTMGALHDGHLSLVRRARRECDKVIVSIFVNPLQFGPREDFSRYPRSFRKDVRLLRDVDAVYRPSTKAIYPEGFRTAVEVAGLSELLCGRFRPGHFRGVATVVMKLLQQVSPDRIYFGEKDYQQLAVLRRMARDLDLKVKVVGCPTVRAADGLALSSRNAYLTPERRALAPLLHRALSAGAREGRRRGASAATILARMRRVLRHMRGAKTDYLEVVDARTLERPRRIRGEMRLLGAVWLGNTRLIDNLGFRV